MSSMKNRRLAIINYVIFLFMLQHLIKSDKITLLDTQEVGWDSWTKNTDKYTGWQFQSQPGSGLPIYGSCIRSGSKGVDDNFWLFSPVIHSKDAININIEMNLKSLPCSDENNCRDSADVMMRKIPFSDQDMKQISSDYNEYINVTNIESIVESQSLSNEESLKRIIYKIDNIDVSFQLALRNQHACILVNRVHVFYTICPKLRNNLVEYPQTAADVGAKHVLGHCIAGAVAANEPLRREQGYRLFSSCNSNGTWSVRSDSKCLCRPGFELSPQKNECLPCKKGFYKNSRSEEKCISCPMNSNSYISAASMCDCADGYYRNLQYETVHVPCTRPPSNPMDVLISELGANYVKLRWKEPKDLGGRNDLVYQVLCVECNSESLKFLPSQKPEKPFVQIENLNPKEKYTFRVYAQNGVSEIASELWKKWEIVEFVTREIPTVEISNIVSRWVTENELKILWTTNTIKESHEDETVDITRYQIALQKVPNQETVPFRRSDKLYGSLVRSYFTKVKSISIEDLSVNETHIFQICAETQYGWGPYSNPVKVYRNKTEIIDFQDENTEDKIKWTSIFSGKYTLPSLIIAFTMVLLSFFAFALSLLFLYHQKMKSSRQQQRGAKNYFDARMNNCVLTEERQNLIDDKIQDRSSLQVITNLQNGKFSTSFIAKTDQTNAMSCHNPYAIQKPIEVFVREVALSTRDAELVTEEIKNATQMAKMNHENVLKCFGTIYEADHVLFVYELAEYGRLDKIMDKMLDASPSDDDDTDEHFEIMNERNIHKYCQGIFCGVEYLNRNSIVFVKFNLSAVFLNQNATVKLRLWTNESPYIQRLNIKQDNRGYTSLYLKRQLFDETREKVISLFYERTRDQLVHVAVSCLIVILFSEVTYKNKSREEIEQILSNIVNRKKSPNQPQSSSNKELISTMSSVIANDIFKINLVIEKLKGSQVAKRDLIVSTTNNIWSLKIEKSLEVWISSLNISQKMMGHIEESLRREGISTLKALQKLTTLDLSRITGITDPMHLRSFTVGLENIRNA